jgi:hypothetical protein
MAPRGCLRLGRSAFCFGYWKAGFSEWANLGPLLLRTQLIVLHGVRSTSFVGAFGPRFSANTDSKPPTQRAAMAQQIRLSAPRNISSLKLRDLPALNIVAPSSSLSPKIVKPILRSNPARGRGLTTAHARGGPGHLQGAARLVSCRTCDAGIYLIFHLASYFAALEFTSLEGLPWASFEQKCQEVI